MKKIPLISILALLSLISACDSKSENTWCKDHKDIHDQHRDTITQVDIVYSDDGELTALLQIPKTDTSREALVNMDNFINATAESQCTQLDSTINEQTTTWQAEFKIDCGVNNRIKAVDVVILNRFPKVSEVEAKIQTPATNKHFVLSRQCDKPIFAL